MGPAAQREISPGRRRLAATAAGLGVLVSGLAAAFVLTYGEDPSGTIVLALGLLAALAGVAAAPFAVARRRPSAFRPVAALAAVVLLVAGVLLLFLGGLALWPSGLMLLLAAALPEHG